TEELRKIITRIASETAAYLRDVACTEPELSRSVGGETVVADIVAEDYIIGALREELGPVRIVTEERGVLGSGDLTIVVDPLDGSKNYLNCISWASVSIAAVPTGGTIAQGLAGVVAPIFYGDPISFARGRGCFRGNAPLTPLRPPEKFVYVYIDHPDAARKVAALVASLGGGYKVRSLGSAALEIAYTGIGRGTAFVDLRSKLRNVDIAAATGIVRECGGVVIDERGNEVNTPVDRVVSAGNIIAIPGRRIAREIARALRLDGEAD
ncbi:MAG: hypothetical protein F7C34_02890, partial [Desulfurococcales archaeon]|nr:hypothetical protein [Desulfurococcales archaeon]